MYQPNMMSSELWTHGLHALPIAKLNESNWPGQTWTPTDTLLQTVESTDSDTPDRDESIATGKKTTKVCTGLSLK